MAGGQHPTPASGAPPSGGAREATFASLSAQEKMAVRKLAHRAGVPVKTAHAALHQPSTLGAVNMNLGSKREHFTQDLERLQKHLEGGGRAAGQLPSGATERLGATLEHELARRTGVAQERGYQAEKYNRYSNHEAKFARTQSLTLATKVSRRLQALAQPAREALTYRGLQAVRVAGKVSRTLASGAEQVASSANSALEAVNEGLGVASRAASQAASSARKSAADGHNLRGGRNQRHMQQEMLYRQATGATVDPSQPLDRNTTVKAWIASALAEAQANGSDVTARSPWSKTFPLLAEVAARQQAAREAKLAAPES